MADATRNCLGGHRAPLAAFVNDRASRCKEHQKLHADAARARRAAMKAAGACASCAAKPVVHAGRCARCYARTLDLHRSRKQAKTLMEQERQQQIQAEARAAALREEEQARAAALREERARAAAEHKRLITSEVERINTIDDSSVGRVLGLGTPDEIARARFRELATRVHPDKHGGSAEASDAYKRLKEDRDRYIAQYAGAQKYGVSEALMNSLLEKERQTTERLLKEFWELKASQLRQLGDLCDTRSENARLREQIKELQRKRPRE